MHCIGLCAYLCQVHNIVRGRAPWGQIVHYGYRPIGLVKLWVCQVLFSSISGQKEMISVIVIAILKYNAYSSERIYISIYFCQKGQGNLTKRSTTNTWNACVEGAYQLQEPQCSNIGPA